MKLWRKPLKKVYKCRKNNNYYLPHWPPEKEGSLDIILKYVHPLKVTMCVISQSDNIAELSCTHRENYQGYHSICKL